MSNLSGKTSCIKNIFPYTPFIFVLIVLLLKPYYLSTGHGDIIYHLVRVHEIVENPIKGLFWDYLVYSPTGRAIWHPPLFHVLFASLWEIGGPRFANSIITIFQVLATVFTAIWVSKREYGYIAGFFAGILVLCNPLGDVFFMALPANFIPILAVLTIYLLPKHRLGAFITSLLGIWTHMVALFIFLPLLIIENFKKNLKYIILLIPSVIFWIFYWVYFKNQTGATNTFCPLIAFNQQINFIALFVIIIVGFFGLICLYKIDKNKFKLMLYFVSSVLLVQFLFSDISRGLQYVVLPLAILGGLLIQKIYCYIKHDKKRDILANTFILILFLVAMVGASSSLALVHYNASWNDLNKPIGSFYNPLIEYIDSNTDQNEIIWVDSRIADNVAWMSGRPVSNGRYGAPPGFVEKTQRINIYMVSNGFLIKNKNNETIKFIPFGK